MTFFITMKSTVIYYLGLIACIALIVSCFLPWAIFNDNKISNEVFTGFYSYQNYYGKPGIFLSFMTAVVFVFMLLPYLWAKRANLFICALTVGYAIFAYLTFGRCYSTYCPQKQFGIYIMISSAIMMLIASMFPEYRLRKS